MSSQAGRFLALLEWHALEVRMILGHITPRISGRGERVALGAVRLHTLVMFNFQICPHTQFCFLRTTL